MNVSKHEIPIYDLEFELILWNKDEFKEVATHLEKEYELKLDEEFPLGLTFGIALRETDALVILIRKDNPEILKTISHEVVHLTDKLFARIGECDESGRIKEVSEPFAYLTGWFFRTILNVLIEMKIIKVSCLT